MNKHLIAALLAASTAIAAPAFASGYGPAPHYEPAAGAPASQRGQSNQTIGADTAAGHADAGAASFGGMPDTASQGGSRFKAVNKQSLYAHH